MPPCSSLKTQVHPSELRLGLAPDGAGESLGAAARADSQRCPWGNVFVPVAMCVFSFVPFHDQYMGWYFSVFGIVLFYVSG